MFAACDGFTCDGDRCIPEGWLCDHEVDCFDGTDQANCSKHSTHTLCKLHQIAKLQSERRLIEQHFVQLATDFSAMVYGVCLPSGCATNGCIAKMAPMNPIVVSYHWILPKTKNIKRKAT